jgi:hypothetical protein
VFVLTCYSVVTECCKVIHVGDRYSLHFDAMLLSEGNCKATAKDGNQLNEIS